MANTNGTAADAQPMTRESLKMPSDLGRSEWELLAGTEDQSDATGADPNSPDGATDDDEVLADAHEEDETESEQASDETPAKVTAKEFAKAAGWSLEEFYRDVAVQVDGEDVPLSDALNETSALRKANAALSQERDDLQARLNQAATTGAPSNVQNIEALVLARQAEECQKVIETTDWTQFEPAQASAEQLKYMNLRDSLLRQAQAKHQEHLQAQETHTRTVLEEADRQTRNLIPEWNDQRVRDAEWQSMKDLGAQYGFKAAEMDAWQDPRARRLLRDFWQSKKTVAKVNKGARTIKKVSKTLGGGTRETARGRPSLADASRAIREASDNKARSEIRQTIDLGDLPPIQQPTK